MKDKSHPTELTSWKHQFGCPLHSG